MNNNYDNVSIRVKKRSDDSLVVIVDYYKNGKIVDQKRTTNKKFIEKIINTATSTIKSGSISNGNLEANYQKTGSIILEDYNSLKEYGMFSKLVSKVTKRVEKEDKAKQKAIDVALTREKKEQAKKEKKELAKTKDSNKELLSSVKNLKVSKQAKFFKKVALKTAKFVPISTLSLVVMTQVMSIVRNLPDFPLFNRGKEINADNSMSSDSQQVVADQIYADIDNNTVKIDQLLKSASVQNNDTGSYATPSSNPMVVDTDIPVNEIKNVVPETTVVQDETITLDDNSKNNFEDVKEEEPSIQPNAMASTLENSENIDTPDEILENKNIEVVETTDNSISATPSEKKEIEQVDTVSPAVTNDAVEELLDDIPVSSPTNDVDSSMTEDLAVMDDVTTPEVVENKASEVSTQMVEDNTDSVVDSASVDNTTQNEIDDTEVISEALQEYNLTSAQFDTLCAVVRQEAGSNPEEVKNVVTTIINRMNSGEWGGTTPWDVITASGQFQAYGAGHYKKYLNHNYDENIPYIVASMLVGNMETTHDWERFNSNSSTSYGGTVLTPGGNRYK